MKSKKQMSKWIISELKCHDVYHKFDKWLKKSYGSDLYSEWRIIEIKGKDGRVRKIKTRSFNEREFNRRLVGYEVQERVERYVKKYCPQIRIVRCDDSIYSSSTILLIPHKKHGITVMFIPQCTDVQNRFFLYGGHYGNLMKEMGKMKSVYNGAL